jgi:hypothetical protein
MILKPADIIITTDKNSWFSKAILAVLNFFQKDEVRYQHVMMAVDNEICIEALNKITFNYTRERMRDFKRFKVIRHRYINDTQRRSIVGRAKSLSGLDYGYIRLALQLFDQAFQTNYFTRRIKDPNYQICSSLVAWSYGVETGIRFGGLSWAAVEPDDIDDEVLSPNSEFETIIEWEKD